MQVRILFILVAGFYFAHRRQFLIHTHSIFLTSVKLNIYTLDLINLQDITLSVSFKVYKLMYPSNSGILV